MQYGNEPQPRAKADWKALGEGKFLSWEDGETKTVLLYKWGQSERDGRLSLEADVLKIDGVEVKIGEKIIRTNGINFIKAVKPFLQKQEEKGKNAALLKITRNGLQASTKYFVESVEETVTPALKSETPVKEDISI